VPLQISIVSGLKTRYSAESDSVAQHPFMVAAVLDPQLKKLSGVPDNVRTADYNHVRKLAAAARRARPMQSAAETAEVNEQEPVPKRQCVQQSSRTAVLQFLNASYDDDDDNAGNDFDGYVSIAVDRKTAVLEWWKSPASADPNTAAVAQQYLAIPTTSTNSKRLFSSMGHLISKLHSRLLPETAEMLVFLNKNAGMFQ